MKNSTNANTKYKIRRRMICRSPVRTVSHFWFRLLSWFNIIFKKMNRESYGVGLKLAHSLIRSLNLPLLLCLHCVHCSKSEINCVQLAPVPCQEMTNIEESYQTSNTVILIWKLLMKQKRFSEFCSAIIITSYPFQIKSFSISDSPMLNFYGNLIPHRTLLIPLMIFRHR